MIQYCADRPKLTLLHHIIVILSHTGMRIGELQKACWSHIDQTPGMWTIPFRGRRGTLEQRKKGPRNKSKRTRNIPILAPVRTVLEQLRLRKYDDDLVLHAHRGGILDHDTIREAFIRDVLTPLGERFPKKNEDAQNLLDGRFHSFRHYYCSSCSNQNVAERVVANWLGHAGGKIIRRYYHLKDDQSLALAASLKFV